MSGVRIEIAKMTSCPKCGLEFNTLMHSFCQHKQCPVRDALNASKMGKLADEGTCQGRATTHIDQSAAVTRFCRELTAPIVEAGRPKPPLPSSPIRRKQTMTKPSRDKTISLRITDEFRQQIEAAQSILPYAPTMTTIVERGIVLAVAEMTQLAALLKERQP